MRTRLEEIIRLTGDDSFSHAARMISIKKEAQAALDEIIAATKNPGAAASGSQTRNPVSPAGATPATPPAK